jgi:hypothetical protein
MRITVRKFEWRINKKGKGISDSVLLFEKLNTDFFEDG